MRTGGSQRVLWASLSRLAFSGFWGHPWCRADDILHRGNLAIGGHGNCYPAGSRLHVYLEGRWGRAGGIHPIHYFPDLGADVSTCCIRVWAGTPRLKEEGS